MADLALFEKNTGILFKDKNLLRQAFLHRSYINENPGVRTGHNERLEFLGDAVLELCVTDFLYHKYPTYAEGELTAVRSALVNAVTLSEVASRVGMNDYLFLSRGEAKDIGRARQYILANTYEAYIGAVYLDAGYETAEAFIRKTILLPYTERVVREKLWRDAKSLVQERSQEYLSVTPQYRVLSESGPDHDKQFTAGIFFGDELIAEGRGRSKQEAEQKAAEAALKKKNWLE